jgi:hypothetical protein
MSIKEAIEIGKSYMFHGRMIYIGRVVELTLFDVVVDHCCWVADMGSGEESRMGNFLKKGINSSTEIEIAPPEDLVPLPRGSFAKFPWHHELPKKSQ